MNQKRRDRYGYGLSDAMALSDAVITDAILTEAAARPLRPTLEAVSLAYH